MFKGWVLTLSLIALFIGPSGGVSLFDVLDRAGSRLSVGVTEAEQAELDFFECLEQTASVIPDMAKVQKVMPDDSYLVQRVGEILYPRLRFAEEGADYSFFVNSDPGDRVLLSSNTCGSYFVGVAKNG